MRARVGISHCWDLHPALRVLLEPFQVSRHRSVPSVQRILPHIGLHHRVLLATMVLSVFLDQHHACHAHRALFLIILDRMMDVNQRLLGMFLLGQE